MKRPARMKSAKKTLSIEGVHDLRLGEFLSQAFISKVLPSATSTTLNKIQGGVEQMFGSSLWRNSTVEDMVTHESWWRFLHYERKFPQCGRQAQRLMADLLLACGLHAYVPARLASSKDTTLSDAAQAVIKKIRAAK